jgi:hypothetical protein
VGTGSETAWTGEEICLRRNMQHKRVDFSSGRPGRDMFKYCLSFKPYFNHSGVSKASAIKTNQEAWQQGFSRARLLLATSPEL